MVENELFAECTKILFTLLLFRQFASVQYRFYCITFYCLTMSDTYDSDGNTNTPSTSTGAKRKKYAQNYKVEWESRPECCNWLTKSLKEKNYAYCKSCNKDINISSGFDAVKRHAASQIHIKSVKCIADQPKMTNFVNREMIQLKHQVREGEIRMAGFVAEHNLPYAITDHLGKLIQKICPDSKVAKNMKCSRTRIQAVVNNVIGQEGFNTLCEDLRQVKFSLIIDESTDRSTTKHLCLVVRYIKKNHVGDYFFGLIPVVTADATTLHKSIVDFFEQYDIPFRQNLIGFASDGASVMMGRHHSVMTLLKADIPHLFIIKCICHSFHLCASYACNKIPRFVEEVVREIYNYFSSSPKRSAEFKEFQLFCNLKIHKLLHPCQTRWLSVHAAISRILEQYQALKLFFINASLNDDIATATNILNKLNDPLTLLFLQFLDFVLPIFNKLNREMQSESARIHMLYSQVCVSLRTLFDCFLKKDYLEKNNLENIDYKNPHNFLAIGDVYYGANAINTLLTDKRLTAEQIHLFQTRCIQFFIEASDQIIQRFPIKNNPLKDLGALSPENVKKGELPSIVPLCRQFPNLMDTNNYQCIDTEWRLLRNMKEIALFSDKTEEFWASVNNMKYGDGTLIFKNICSFVFKILSLPHSSANVERIFSSINLMKTKTRNKLSTESIVGLLHTKRVVTEEDQTCFNFDIEKKMFEKIASKRWYEDEDK
ncbi:uncharacterized protein LOC125062236 [Pieris napi]|uniref:uncharacterized protein LOC125062236 n=1 Tax=Pieris napi TaxID=78633 RepID=UPI001FB8ECAC|nr:uncharacterized protein LOC125062236 [Pieris napi]